MQREHWMSIQHVKAKMWPITVRENDKTQSISNAFEYSTLLEEIHELWNTVFICPTNSGILVLFKPPPTEYNNEGLINQPQSWIQEFSSFGFGHESESMIDKKTIVWRSSHCDREQRWSEYVRCAKTLYDSMAAIERWRARILTELDQAQPRTFSLNQVMKLSREELWAPSRERRSPVEICSAMKSSSNALDRNQLRLGPNLHRGNRETTSRALDNSRLESAGKSRPKEEELQQGWRRGEDPRAKWTTLLRRDRNKQPDEEARWRRSTCWILSCIFIVDRRRRWRMVPLSTSSNHYVHSCKTKSKLI